MAAKSAGRLLSLFIILLLSGCALPSQDRLTITEAKIVSAVDEKLNPIKVTDIFPEGTSKVFCWFSWKNAQVNVEVVTKWHYITDDIHILDYAFALPRTEGQGSVALAMPDGKKLPSGLYRIELSKAKHTLKSLTFKVE